jgi:putative DNA primase/helicase
VSNAEEPLPPEPGEETSKPKKARKKGPPKWAAAIGIASEEQPEELVLAQLDIGETGPKKTALNVHRVLSLDSRWRGKLRYNAFTSQHMCGDLPMSDEGTTEIALWLAKVYRLDVSSTMVAEQVRYEATKHSFHPVREYLEGLVWDNRPRIGKLLPTYFGAESNDLVDILGQYWMISAIVRIMVPGEKVDTTLILVGDQGARKSSAIKTLAKRAEWFSDTPLDLSSKDLFESIQGVWLYELGELDAFKGRDWARIKSMLSSPVDKWRRPYGRNTVQVPRQVVFAGTTNQDEFLGDPTGARRFWPVRIGKILLEQLREDVDQLWAEALALWRREPRWWLDVELGKQLVAASAEFQISDPWEPSIMQWVSGRISGFTIADILESVIKKERRDWSNADQQRIAGILKRAGYAKTRTRTGTDRVVKWEKRP